MVDAAPPTTGGTTRRRVLAWSGLVVVVVAYVGLLVLYAVSGKTRGVGEDATPPSGGILVQLHAQALEGTPQRLAVDVDIDAAGSLVEPNGFTLERPITVLLDPTAGSREVSYPAGQVPAVNRVELRLDGDIRNWPFDRYGADLVIGVYDGPPSDGRPLPTTVQIDGQVQGWRIRVTERAGLGADTGLQVFLLEAGRSGDTLAFAAILLAVMVALAFTACFVSVTTIRGRRALQPTFMSWMAAMLFATIPLRNFLPGSPPAGSWVDALVVLWVIVGLVAALAMYVTAWYRQGKPSDAGRA